MRSCYQYRTKDCPALEACLVHSGENITNATEHIAKTLNPVPNIKDNRPLGKDRDSNPYLFDDPLPSQLTPGRYHRTAKCLRTITRVNGQKTGRISRRNSRLREREREKMVGPLGLEPRTKGL